MSTATEESYKSERSSSQKDSKSRKKMNIRIAIRCNSFKVVGALLICTGVMNFYLSSIWVSAVIVFAGCLTKAWVMLIKSRMNWKYPCNWIRWVVDLSLLPFFSRRRCLGLSISFAPLFGFRLTKADGDEIPLIVLLLRHGESTANVDPAVYESTPDHAIPLSQRGQMMTDVAGKISFNLRKLA